MTDKLKNIIQEEVMKLPKEGQEAIGSLDWVKITEEIGTKYLLNETEMTDFQVETLLVLVGITDPEFYATNIENQVGTTKDNANKVADEVVQKIFIPISNILVENIKKSGKLANAKPEQNLDFILSGGDYSVFVEPIFPPPALGEGSGGGDSEFRKSPPRPLGTPPPQGGEGIRKMDDIKSKFTI